MMCCDSMTQWIDRDTTVMRGQISPVCIRTDVWDNLGPQEQKRRYPEATSAGWHTAIWNKRVAFGSGYAYKKIERCPFCKKELT